MRKHLLGIEGMSPQSFVGLLDDAETFVEVGERELKKVPALRGKTVINLFLESSTRTRASFEIAGKRLSADVINIGGSESSVAKGETFLDTARNLQAMAPDIIVVRHSESGAAHFLARHLPDTSIINAGDGLHEHPTQALLDCLTLRQHLRAQGRELSGLTVAIVGDIRHSRVARSNIWAHALLGNKIRLVAPPTLLPPEVRDSQCFGVPVEVHHQLERGIEGADVVMALRMQLERQDQHFVPSLQEYTNEFCITEQKLARWAPNAVVMHPGPINRGTEISSEVVDGPRSLITDQVRNGVAVRMAVLFNVSTGKETPLQ